MRRTTAQICFGVGICLVAACGEDAFHAQDVGAFSVEDVESIQSAADTSRSDNGLIPGPGLDLGQAPFVEMAEPLVGAVYAFGEEVVFWVRVDDDKDPYSGLPLRFTSDLQGPLGVVIPNGVGLGEFRITTLVAGMHQVTVSVTDSDAMESSVSLKVLINGAPSAPSVKIVPENPTTDDDLLAYITESSHDPNRSSVQLEYRYRWSNGVVTIEEGGDTLPAAVTEKGETWTVSVTAYDGFVEGPMGEAHTTVQLCVPYTSYCDNKDLLVCSVSGLSIDWVQTCAEAEFCGGGGCNPQQCAPDAPVCDGSNATMCDSIGSGYVGEGTDCNEQGKACVAGSCLDAPDGYVLCPAGSFTMGCSPGQLLPTGCGDDEYPAHSITLSRPFWIGATEVTQASYQAVMGANPSTFSGCADCPVEMVSWFDALLYANALSELEGLSPCYAIDGTTASVLSPSGSPYDCEGYRLPTEAEWEYASRAGTDLPFSGSANIDETAWYKYNTDDTTKSVAQKLPNAWGIYDMSGNVWEWVWDWYLVTYYYQSPVLDPLGPPTGFAPSGYPPTPARSLRGGSWKSNSSGPRSSVRSNEQRTVSRADLGFRLVRTVPLGE